MFGRDRIHFSKEGYGEQGVLLYKALVRSCIDQNTEPGVLSADTENSSAEDLIMEQFISSEEGLAAGAAEEVVSEETVPEETGSEEMLEEELIKNEFIEIESGQKEPVKKEEIQDVE